MYAKDLVVDNNIMHDPNEQTMVISSILCGEV